MPETMFGVQLTRHGGPEVLVWNDAIPLRAPGPDEVQIRVLAAWVNNTDINTRVGWCSSDVTGATDASGEASAEDGGWSGALKFPLIQGGDLCGQVEAVGERVDPGWIGKRVTCQTNQPFPTVEEPTKFEAIGSEYDGAFAQYCVVPADRLFDVSSSPLSDAEIGAMPCAYGTALNLINNAQVAAGKRVLVTGASGGVGLAAVQIAVLKGAEVTAVCASGKTDVVQTMGAAHVLTRDEVPPVSHFDCVIDVVGGAGFGSLIDALKPGGHYAVSGAIAGPIVEADLRNIYLFDRTIHGCSFQPREDFAELVGWINQGTLRPLVSKTYPLREISIAQEDFASKKHPGKLVLIP